MANLSFNEVERFLTDLSALIRAGIPVPDGLKRLSSEMTSERLKQLVQEVGGATAQGQSLAQALDGASVGVPKSLISLFRSAESVGTATGSLLTFTATHSRRLREHRSRIATVMFYPWLVLLAILGIVLFLSLAVVPRFEDIFKQLGAELPWLTQRFVDLSGLLRTNFFVQATYLLVVLAAIAVAVSEQLRDQIFSRLSLAPGYSSLVALSDAAIVMKYLGVMLRNGLPLPDALRSISLSVSLNSSRESIERMAEAAEKGQPTSPHLSPLFPATVVHLYQQGESTGRLPEVCESLGDWADQTFEQHGRRIAGFAEPAIILIVFVFIAMMLISLYLPLFSIPRLVGR